MTNNSIIGIGQNDSDTTMNITNDNVVDISYLSKSTLSNGLFDPPSPANFTNSLIANASFLRKLVRRRVTRV